METSQLYEALLQYIELRASRFNSTMCMNQAWR